jgi:hypothetical protein
LQYGFSVYSEALKKNHGLSQQQAQLIGTVINSSNYLCGILAGCTFDALARFPRIGPRICCAIALVLAGLGYPLLWALAADRIHVSGGASSATCAIAGAAFVASLSGPFCDSVAMAVGVNNFPAHRGQVVGQLKSFVGLSASLHLAVYSAIPHSTASDFILLQVLPVYALPCIMIWPPAPRSLTSVLPLR